METLTVEQIAKQLNVSPQSIRRYIRSGELKATKNRLHKGQGGQWIVNQQDLDQFINNLQPEEF